MGHPDFFEMVIVIWLFLLSGYVTWHVRYTDKLFEFIKGLLSHVDHLQRKSWYHDDELGRVERAALDAAGPS